MLEDFARDYFASEDTRLLLYSLAIVAGGLIGVTLNRHSFRLRRLPFFGFSVLLLVLFASVEYLSRSFVLSIVGANSWPHMFIEQLSCLTLGYLLSVLAAARCRDGFGDNRKSFVMAAIVGLLVVKLAFFALLIKGSQVEDHSEAFA